MKKAPHTRDTANSLIHINEVSKDVPSTQISREPHNGTILRYSCPFQLQKIPVYLMVYTTSITDMESGTPPHFLRNLFGTVTRGLLLAIIFPLVPAFLFGISLSSSLALVSSTFVIEYGAAALGIGLGLPPIYILYVLVCVASGITLTMFDVFDRVGEYSPRVSRFLEKSEERAHRSTILTKYGIFGLIPCVLTLGFYVCPAISKVMGWRRDLSILLIMGGYISISIVTLLTTMGIFRLVF